MELKQALQLVLQLNWTVKECMSCRFCGWSWSRFYFWFCSQSWFRLGFHYRQMGWLTQIWSHTYANFNLNQSYCVIDYNTVLKMIGVEEGGVWLTQKQSSCFRPYFLIQHIAQGCSLFHQYMVQSCGSGSNQGVQSIDNRSKKTETSIYEIFRKKID